MKRFYYHKVFWGLLIVAVMFGAVNAFGATQKAPVELKVEVFDRATPGYTADNNYWTRYVQEQFGDPNRIKFKFIPVYRLQEIEKLNVLMASNDAPDIVFTYDQYAVYNYVRYGGLTDLQSELDRYGKRLKKYLGKDLLREGVFDGKQYALPAKRILYGAISGFIRKDWLDKLGLPLPQTTRQWYETMKAFKEKDPGKKGERVIPFALMSDIQNITWSSQLLLDSFKKKMTPDEMDYLPDWLMPGFKDGMRFLNKMYHEGLISPEFALDKYSDPYNKDIQQGRAGFFINGFDLPYRMTPGLAAELKKNVPGANLVPCDPFTNSQGKHLKRVYGRNGLYIMIPKSSKRVTEAIKYLDWMARPEVLDFLINGKKGVNYQEYRDGIPVNIPVEGEKRLTTDIALIVNGKDYGNSEKNIKAGALTCPGFEKEWLSSYKISLFGDKYIKRVFPIESEARLKRSLYEKEAEIFVKTIVAQPAEFDRTYENLVQEYMRMGGKQVMEDRKAYLKANRKK